MRGPVLLLSHSLKRIRTMIGAMGLLLALFQVMLIVVARSIHNSGGFEQLSALLPPFARELMGPSMASVMSFGGIVSLGYFHLSVMGSLVGLSIAIATTPTSEIETGFIDLILARPLARHWIITRSIVVAILCTAVLLLLMMIGTWGGLHTLAPKIAGWPKPHLIYSLAINLGLLMMAWSGVAMAIGAASRRRSVAGAIAGFLALGTFLLDYVGRLWQPAEKIGWLSPFRYYNPFDLVMGNPAPVKNLLVLSGIALVGFGAAYVLFSRRDISH
jgi:beta-exotoxin I transport system permease protein